MSRGTYSVGKRQRDIAKAKKKEDKAQKRQARRERGPGEVPMADASEMTGRLPTVEEAMQRIANRAAESRGTAGIPCRLFVGSLDESTTESTLRQAFEAFGPLTDAVIMRDRNTGQSRGFGFVTMANRKDAARAVEALAGTELDGSRLVVNVATERHR